MSQRFKPFLTVALIIEHENRFLMVEEYQENNELCFGTVAGHVDAQESIIEAAIREGLEETGCPVELIDLVGVYNYVKQDETILRFTFRAKLKDGDPTKVHIADPDGDIVAIRWYTKEEIYENKDKWRTRLIGLNYDDYFNGQSFPLSLVHEVRS